MVKNRAAAKWFQSGEVDEFIRWYKKACARTGLVPTKDEDRLLELFKMWKEKVYLRNVKRHGARSQARSTDPITSHVAAAKVNILKSDQAILKAIRNGYTTIKEVSECINPEKETSYSPRFAPLRRAGLIEVIGKKKNAKTGMTVNEYELTKEGEKAIS